MPCRPLRSRAGLSAIPTALVACLITAPAPAADFYAGKTIDFLVGGDVGGGYDIYARVVGRHLNRFIPGLPTIVLRNQPGPAAAARRLFSMAARPRTPPRTAPPFPPRPHPHTSPTPPIH